MWGVPSIHPSCFPTLLSVLGGCVEGVCLGRHRGAHTGGGGVAALGWGHWLPRCWVSCCQVGTGGRRKVRSATACRRLSLSYQEEVSQSIFLNITNITNLIPSVGDEDPDTTFLTHATLVVSSNHTCFQSHVIFFVVKTHLNVPTCLLFKKSLFFSAFLSFRRGPFPLCSMLLCFSWRVSAGSKPSDLSENVFFHLHS